MKAILVLLVFLLALAQSCSDKSTGPETIDNTHKVPAEFATIQDAVDFAVDGDTVLVADGIYTGEGNRDIIVENKAIVIKSENGPEKTIIDIGGSLVSPRRGFYIKNEGVSSTNITGFDIQNGYVLDDGGGMLVDSFTCIEIDNCKLRNNYAENAGGGVHCRHSVNLRISGCTFDYNSSACGSGGIDLMSLGDAIITNSIFSNNSGQYGGAILATFGGNIRIERCEFNSNESGMFGGGICVQKTILFIKDTKIKNNLAQKEHFPLLGAAGGGVGLLQSAGIFENCIFVSNDFEDGSGGAIACMNARVQLYKCIMFNNREWLYDGDGNLMDGFAIECCNIFGNDGGDWIGSIKNYLGNFYNISADPLFCDPENGDFRLQASSPCAPENSECGELIGPYGVGCDSVE